MSILPGDDLNLEKGLTILFLLSSNKTYIDMYIKSKNNQPLKQLNTQRTFLTKFFLIKSNIKHVANINTKSQQI